VDQPVEIGTSKRETMADQEDNLEGTGNNQVSEEQSTFVFPIVDPDTVAQMKNIPPSALPHFHGKVHEDPDSFLFEFDILCRIYDYSTDAQKLRLFPVTLKDSALRWFMGLGGNTITSWDQMKRVFLSKYQEYCKTRDMQDEIFTIIQDDDEMLEDYLERFMYILQRSKLKLDPNTIRTLFLRGLTDNARNNLNLLGQGDISQQTFEQICELCRKFSRNQYRSSKGTRNRNRKTESTDAMIIGLENKMENMKIDIMNTVTKQLDSLKF